MSDAGGSLTGGVREILLNFLGPHPSAVLEVGCAKAWLKPSPYDDDRSAKALAERRLVETRAEALPFADATFDRVFCVNALHHFADRARFFAEARRVLRPGGGLLTIGMDPHTDRDDWWAHQYVDELSVRDRERFARVRTLRGEMALAGFGWTESMEADHIEAVQPASDVLANEAIDPAFMRSLSTASDEEWSRGVERLRQANEAAGGELQLVTDLRLYATIGWVG